MDFIPLSYNGIAAGILDSQGIPKSSLINNKEKCVLTGIIEEEFLNSHLDLLKIG